MKINGDIYDILLSFTLIWAAVKIITFQNNETVKVTNLKINKLLFGEEVLGFLVG